MFTRATYGFRCKTVSIAEVTLPECNNVRICFWKTGDESVSAAGSLVIQRVLNVLVWISDVSLDKLQDNGVYNIPIL